MKVKEAFKIGFGVTMGCYMAELVWHVSCRLIVDVDKMKKTKENK